MFIQGFDMFAISRIRRLFVWNNWHPWNLQCFRLLDIPQGCQCAVWTSAQHSVPHWKAWRNENQSRIFQNCPVSKCCGHFRWHTNSNPRHINRRWAFICVQEGMPCHQCPSLCYFYLFGRTKINLTSWNNSWIFDNIENMFIFMTMTFWYLIWY